MVDNSDGLLREVEEELRRERYTKLWDQYGYYVVAGAVLIVVAVGGYKFWQRQQMVEAQQSGAKYEQALTTLSSGKTDDAAKSFKDFTNSAHGGYRALAELQLAGTQIKQGNAEAAQTTLDKVAAGPSNSQILREFATIQSVALNVGEADFTEVKNRLNALSADGNPWRSSARELIGLAAFRAGKYEDARQMFRLLLSDSSTPKGVLGRANTMLASIAAEELKLKTKTEAPAGAAASEDDKSNGSGAETDGTAKSAPDAASEASTAKKE